MTMLQRVSNLLSRRSLSCHKSPQLQQQFSAALRPFSHYRSSVPFLVHHRCFASATAKDTEQSTGNTNADQIVYHAGLRNTVFTNECDINNESQVIPIFRVMGYDGQLQGGWDCPFTEEECIERYKFMVQVSVWDMMMYNVQRQGRFSFYIQNQGEECLQTAIANALGKDDHLYCQYRELGVIMWRGFTLTDTVNQLFSTAEEEGKGRQMPISYTKKSIGLQTICTPLGSQIPHAAGAGYAFKIAGEKRAAVTFFGEGAASEGDFHAALNFASVLKSQTVFVCRNNGYAISTPVKDQYFGDGIAIRGLAYGMDTIRVDGNDFFATYIAAKKAYDLCVNQSRPVLLECMTYRFGHHSTSDDSAQYRANNEMKAWTRPGVEGIARFRIFLENHGLWNDEQEENLRKTSKQTMLDELKTVAAKKSCAIIPGVFEDVYDTMPWHLQEQADHLRQHLQKNKHLYEMERFPSVD